MVEKSCLSLRKHYFGLTSFIPSPTSTSQFRLIQQHQHTTLAHTHIFMKCFLIHLRLSGFKKVFIFWRSVLLCNIIKTIFLYLKDFWCSGKMLLMKFFDVLEFNAFFSHRFSSHPYSTYNNSTRVKKDVKMQLIQKGSRWDVKLSHFDNLSVSKFDN